MEQVNGLGIDKLNNLRCQRDTSRAPPCGGPRELAKNWGGYFGGFGSLWKIAGLFWGLGVCEKLRGYFGVWEFVKNCGDVGRALVLSSNHSPLAGESKILSLSKGIRWGEFVIFVKMRWLFYTLNWVLLIMWFSCYFLRWIHYYQYLRAYFCRAAKVFFGVFFAWDKW